MSTTTATRTSAAPIHNVLRESGTSNPLCMNESEPAVSETTCLAGLFPGAC
jgi:hypothetical protein